MAQSSVIKEAVVKLVTDGFRRVHADLKSLEGQAAALARNNLVVRVGAAGTDAARQALRSVADRLDAFGQKIAAATSAARTGLLAMAGSVTGFVAAADPVRFTVFTQLLQVFAQRVGSLFIPVLDKAARLVLAAIGWFDGLSQSTKDNIVRWTGVAAAVLAGVAAFGAAVAVVGKVAAVLAAVTTPAGAVVAAVGAVAGAFALVAGKGDVLVGVGKAWDGIRDAALRVWAAVQPVVQQLQDWFGRLSTAIGERLAPAFEAVQAAGTRIGEALLPVWEKVRGYLESVGAVVISLASDAFGALAAVVAWVADKAAGLAEILGPVLAAGVDVARTAFEGFVTAAVRGINLLIDGINLLIAAHDRLNPLFSIGPVGKLTVPDFGGKGGGAGPAPKGKPGEENKPGTGPLMAPGKVESMGLEEVAKRAQAAVNGTLDPARIAEMQLKEQQRNNALQQENNNLLRDVQQGLRGQPKLAQIG